MEIISKLQKDLTFKVPEIKEESYLNNIIHAKLISKNSAFQARSLFNINVLNDFEKQNIFGLDVSIGSYFLKKETSQVHSFSNIKVLNIPFVENYNHCLNDVLPKLLGEESGDFDIVYTCNSEILTSLLSLFEINLKKVKPINESIIIDCENIVIENHTACHLRNKDKINLLKKQIDKVIENKFRPEINNRLIYCSRNATNVMHKRKMEDQNEKDIISLLEEYCIRKNLLFTFFNGQENNKVISHINQIKLFSEAKVVIGPHGGAMANLIYLNPNNNCSICEFTSGHEAIVQKGPFVNHYNFLYGFLPEKLYKYYLIPFSKNSSYLETRIDLDNLKVFLERI